MKTRNRLALALVGGSLAVSAALTGCADPTAEVAQGIPERAYDDELVVLGEFQGFVDEAGDLQITLVPSDALRQAAAAQGLAIEELTELTQATGSGRGLNPANTYELVTCSSSLSPACSGQYGATIEPGTGTDAARCGTIPGGRSGTCFAADVELRQFYGVDVSNAYIQFTALGNGVQAYDGAAETLGMSGSVGTVYRYGTLEPGPASGPSFDSPYHQQSLRRWRFSYPAGTTDFSFTFSGRVYATVSSGRAPYQASVTRAGEPTANAASQGCVSNNGDYVVFASTTPLHPDHTNGFSQVYRVRRRTGAVELISRATGASGAIGDNNSTDPCLTPDGNIVVYQSSATNLVAGDTNSAADIFARVVSTSSTESISRSATGCGSGGSSDRPSISSDGRYVAFDSSCASLCGGQSSTTGCRNGRRQVYRWDRVGATMVGVSIRDATDGAVDADVQFGGWNTSPAGAQASQSGWISADGDRVVFQSRAGGTNGALTASDGTVSDIFVRTISTDSTVRITNNSGGATIGSRNGHISSDGAFVAFETNATNLVSGVTDSNGFVDIVRCASGGGSCVYVSAPTGSTSPTGNGASAFPWLSSDGSLVAFESSATNLSGSDTNGATDVFLRTVGTNSTTLYSVNGAGSQGNGSSTRARLSPGADYLAFQSAANNLQADTAGSFDGDGSAVDFFTVRR